MGRPAKVGQAKLLERQSNPTPPLGTTTPFIALHSFGQSSNRSQIRFARYG
jgi:hypothetical protein